MSHIFISYSHKDKDYVHKLQEALQNEGFDAWIDDRINYADEWLKVIQKQLDTCDAFIIVMSQNSFDSDMVQNEVTRAREKKKPIFPLLLDGDSWLVVQARQYVDVRDRSLPREKFYERLETFSPRNKLGISLDERLETLKSQATRYELVGDLWNALNIWYEIRRLDSRFPRVDRKIDELEAELLRIKQESIKEAKPVESIDRPDRVTLFDLLVKKLRALQSNVLKRGSFLKITGIFAFIAVAIWGSSLLIPYIEWLISTPTPEPSATSAPASAPIATSAKSEITDEKDVQMVLVPAGEFVMGRDLRFTNEKPAHSVNLDAFYIDKFEVTNALYRDCDEQGDCPRPTYTSQYYGSSRSDRPVVYITWEMANTYCQWRGARLPTEAEWEKAARGTDERPYPWGPQELVVQYANYKGTGSKDIGSYPSVKSPYGAFDLAGNVAEWVSDWYSPDYYQTVSLENSFNPSGPVDSPYQPSHNFYGRVVRGGSWSSTENHELSTTYRDHANPESEADDLGFRCAKDAP